MQRTFVNVVLGVLLAIMIGWILVIGRPVILPIVAGLIVAYIVLGLAEFVGSVPRLSALVLVLISNIGTIIASVPRYEAQLLSMIQMATEWLGIEAEPSWQTLRDDALARIDLQRTIGATIASVTAIVGTFVLVMIYAGFLVAERRAFARKIDRISDDAQQIRRIREIIADVNSRIGTYLLMKTLVNVVLGLVSYAIMRVAGIEFAGFWALMIGLFNYIPYVGSFLGVTFPVLLSAMQFGAIGPVVTITLALSATQMAVGNGGDPLGADHGHPRDHPVGVRRHPPAGGADVARRARRAEPSRQGLRRAAGDGRAQGVRRGCRGSPACGGPRPGRRRRNRCAAGRGRR